MSFAEMQPMVLCLLSRQIGEEVAYQGLFCFVAAQVVLRAVDHHLQPYQWVIHRRYQLLYEHHRPLVRALPLALASQVT